MKITSTQNEVIKSLHKLKQKKHRDATQEVLIEGEHMVEEAMKQGLVIKTYGLEEADVLIDEKVAEKLSMTSSGSKIFAHIRKPNHKLEKGTRYLICDGVQDPGNVGTMIRTAHSFGFDAVILSLDSADAYNDKTLRSTQGAIFHIPVLSMDLKEAYIALKEMGVTLLATDVNAGAKTLQTVDTSKSLGIIMGSEGKGVRDFSLSMADDNLFIETRHFESLNVSVASGIILYTLRK
ncbi:MAG: RNA methyltransferase [Erysipelothrix sp.]|nr:RNA methyltransferase [Erysipelothrix sp.]